MTYNRLLIGLIVLSFLTMLVVAITGDYCWPGDCT